MTFQLTPQGFRKDGKPFFLVSGEMHYFRVKKRDWPRHLEKMKKAGLDAVTTYIPWSWHEPEPGSFDLSGRTDPQRDIEGFLDLCGQLGLVLVVKPGPYILAEYQDQGIPKWLIAQHPEIQVCGPDGKPNNPFVASYMHPVYREYASKWFDRIIPPLSERQSSRGGPIIMMQICNEVGLQQWLSGCGDYNPATLAYFFRFLSGKYAGIGELNRLYGTQYESFDKARAPHGNTECPADVARYRDWHEFHRWYYGLYMDDLVKDLRRRGIDVPFYENVPGWAYGRAVEFPVCLTQYNELTRKNPEVLLGLDHIPENVDFRNFHDAFIMTEMVRAVQACRLPVYSAEFQAGSREHSVRTYPGELELFYKSALAGGVHGWNYYMFSQGKNPPGEGVYGPTFYWDTPLDDRGREQPLYSVVVSINRWIKANEDRLLGATRPASVAAAFYKPYYETEFLYPLFAKDKYFRPERAGLSYDIKSVRDLFFYDGLLKSLHILNCPPELPDISLASVEDLLHYRQVWVFCLEFMDPATQQKLVDFVQAGGHAVFYPVLPSRDLEGRPCDVLRRGLAVRETGVSTPVDTKVRYFDLEPVSSFGLIREIDCTDAGAVARIGEKVCGIVKTVGKGKAAILGTIPNYQIEEHLDVFRRFLADEDIKPDIIASDPDLTVIRRTGSEGSFIFVLNFHRVDKAAFLIVAGPESLRIPATGRLFVPASTGLILPLDCAVDANGGRIVYATSELFGVRRETETLALHLKGPRGTMGEVLVRMDKPPQKALLNGKEIRWTVRDRGILFKYRHASHERILEIALH